MKLTKKTTWLTALGLMVTLPGALALASTASAQPGSRLCGQAWVSDEGSLYELYEVSKTDEVACREAINGEADPNTSPWPKEPQEKQWQRPPWQDIDAFWFNNGENDEDLGTIYMGLCEDYANVCDKMNRSDTVFEMNRYWVKGEDVRRG